MRLRWWLAATAVALGTTTSSAPAAAQAGAPKANDPSLVPPKLLTSTEVAYPRDAHGDSAVRLLVVVNSDGTVRSARAVEGESPFTEAAEAAVREWRFQPATRDGAPIAATIRLEVLFHEKLVETPPEAPPPRVTTTPEPKPASTATTPPPPPPPGTPQVAEVTVSGERQAPTVTSFTRAEVRQLPGAFGDPFRAIEALPGVTPIISGLPFFYVRGAPPGNVGYFLDGVRVPYLYHVGLGPSVIHPGMVERVDLYPGGYPAQFGRFAGGIVSGEATAPNPVLHGEGNIRLFDAGVLAEGGFDNGRGTVLVGGRYSYTAAIISLLAKDTKLDYRDFQTRVTYDITPKDRVSIFTFGSYDLVAQTTNNVENVLFGSEFYRTDLRYDHLFDDGTRARLAVTLGFDQTRIAFQRNGRDKILGIRAEVVRPMSDEVTLRAGADATLDIYEADTKTYGDPEDPSVQKFNQLFPQRNDTAVGARADIVYRPSRWVEVTPGVRVDLYGSGGATAIGVDPRISARLGVTDDFRIIHAYGIAHQPPSFLVPIPGLSIGNLQGGLQTSAQASAGIEADLPEAITATVTGFQNLFLNMTDTLGLGGDRGNNLLSQQRALGKSFGLEVYLRRKLSKRLGGYVSYTLSRSTRSVGSASFPSAFDRTHVANAALAYDLGRNWRAGTRLVFYTGVPVDKVTDGVIAPAPSANPERDPPFYRIDIRLEKRWTVGEKGWISFVFEVLNATLHKEIFNGTPIGPITIPSIGVEGGFSQ